jgi:alpha-tubulin suppressor-like RCC1 family protein
VILAVLTAVACNSERPRTKRPDAPPAPASHRVEPGEKSGGQPDHEPPVGPWTLVAAGWAQTCGLRGHALYCWGGHGEGEPDGERERHSPTRLDAAENWSTVSLGANHGCGIQSGRLYCWGANRFGVLGQGIDDDSLRFSFDPRPVGEAKDWEMIATGYDHTAGIRDGRLFGWGRNGPNVLPIEGAPIILAPKPIGSARDWQTVGLHKESSCGIRGGSLYCWGSNDDARLGQGYDSHVLAFSAQPRRVGRETDWSALTIGDFFVCAIRSGALYCWGANNSGQQGTGDDVLHMTPTRVGEANDWTQVAAGEEHVCGIRSRSLYCWGRDYDGQLGIGRSGGTGCRGGQYHQCHEPQLLDAANVWDAVAVGGFHTCGIRAGHLFCWGRNDRGQLGLGDTKDRYQPQEVR